MKEPLGQFTSCPGVQWTSLSSHARRSGASQAGGAVGRRRQTIPLEHLSLARCPLASRVGSTRWAIKGVGWIWRELE